MATRQLHHEIGFLIAFAVTASFLTYRGTAAETKASVRVEVTTEADEIVLDPNIELIDVATQKKTGEFRHSTASDIPYGVYLLRVREPGFKRFEQKLTVSEREVVVKVRILVLAEGDRVF